MKFYNFRSCPTELIVCMTILDSHWLPFYIIQICLKHLPCPIASSFSAFFNVFVGVKWNSSTHLLKCFFFGSLYFIGFKLSGQKCVNLSVLNQITIIIVCRRADRIPQYLLININSKQIQYHCILLKMHLFLLFQTL